MFALLHSNGRIRIVALAFIGCAGLFVAADSAFAQDRPTGHGVGRTPGKVRDVSDDRWLEAIVKEIEKNHGTANLASDGPGGLRAEIRSVKFDPTVDPETENAPVTEREAWRGVILANLRSRQVRLQLSNGLTMTLNGPAVWLDGAQCEVREAPMPEAAKGTEKPAHSRADVDMLFDQPRSALTTTWHFITMPFRFRDEDSWKQGRGRMTLRDRWHYGARLSFTRDPGRAAEHWYDAYLSHHERRIAVIAYYANLDGRDVHPDRAQLHAAVFDEYVDVDGMLLPARWTVQPWSRADGLVGEPLGYVELTNHELVRIDPQVFHVPPDAQVPDVPLEGDGEVDDVPADEPSPDQDDSSPSAAAE